MTEKMSEFWKKWV